MKRFGKLIRRTAAAAVIVAATAAASASAEAGERRLNLVNVNNGEKISVVYSRDGRYVEEGLAKLDWFLRDWRRNEPRKMDRRLYDVLWEIWRQSGSGEAIHVHSAYRTPKTNALLRSRSSSVARNSQHMQGTAIDFRIPGVSSKTLRDIALKMEAGGVGYYPKANNPFVHVDVGSVRHWPPISRDQLLALFPDGRSPHLGTMTGTGKGLPSFKEALESLTGRKKVHQVPKTAPLPEPRPVRIVDDPVEVASHIQDPDSELFPESAFLPAPQASISILDALATGRLASAVPAKAPDPTEPETKILPKERIFHLAPPSGKGPRLRPAQRQDAATAEASRRWTIVGRM